MKISLILAAAVLTPSLAVAQQTKPETKKELDPMKCKRMPVTGSLVQSKKVCMSEADWRQQRDDANNLGSDKICVGASCSGAAGPN
jgi:hypothetical protein